MSRLAIVLPILAIILFGVWYCGRSDPLLDMRPEIVEHATEADAKQAAIQQAASLEPLGGFTHRVRGASMAIYDPDEARPAWITYTYDWPVQIDQAVIMRRRDGGWNLHRVIQDRGDGRYRLRGDGNLRADPKLLTQENYIGTLVPPLHVWIESD